jgi:two-component system, LytTR family, response regulator
MIIDDERLARLRIRNYLQEHHPDFELREACDGYEALETIPHFQPEIIFLDVEMPELSGFDVLCQIENPFFQVIFETAYDQFALRAFEVNACDYLLKPFSDDRLQNALARALRRDQGEAQLKRLESHLREQGKYLEKLVVKIGNRSKLLECRNIRYFLSEEHSTRVFLETVNYDYDYSLNFLEERLDPNRFIRIHRNCIVRLEEISSFSQKTNMSVTLRDGTILKVARNRTSPLLERCHSPSGPFWNGS